MLHIFSQRCPIPNRNPLSHQRTVKSEMEKASRVLETTTEKTLLDIKAAGASWLSEFASNGRKQDVRKMRHLGNDRKGPQIEAAK